MKLIQGEGTVHVCSKTPLIYRFVTRNWLTWCVVNTLKSLKICKESGLQPHWPANILVLLSPQAPPLISLRECWPYRCKRLFSVGSGLQTVTVSALNHRAFYPIPFICILKISPVIQETVVIIKRVEKKKPHIDVWKSIPLLFAS